MTNAKTLDKQISNYLPRLTLRQKQTVLTVVKTFADEEDEIARRLAKPDREHPRIMLMLVRADDLELVSGRLGAMVAENVDDPVLGIGRIVD